MTIDLLLALTALALALAAAVAHSPRIPEATVALAGTLLLLAAGALHIHGIRTTLSELGPTVGFLAALLVLAEGCRGEGLFEAIGTVMAARALTPRRLLGIVFIFASAVTAVLSLDATVLLLTPVVFATVARTRWSRSPYLYACGHLSNSASLLLPVSNLTNLLAFHDSRLSFTRFTALMALPWLAAIAVEWVVIGRCLRTAAAGAGATAPGASAPAPAAAPPPAPAAPAAAAAAVGRRPPPRRALLIVGLTLLGFMLSPLLGLAPLWVATAGAAAISLPRLQGGGGAVIDLLRAAQPGFLVFVLALGMIVHAAGTHGLDSALRSLLPTGASLGDLLLTALISAVVANLLNNLPATLLLAPLAIAGGPAAVLAVLIGVNIGPNLTPVGSLATLLWRRVLLAHGTDISLRRFLSLGLASAPVAMGAAGSCLWAMSRLLL